MVEILKGINLPLTNKGKHIDIQKTNTTLRLRYFVRLLFSTET